MASRAKPKTTAGEIPSNKSVIICALGVWPNGERKIVGFHLSEKEDRFSWNKLISNLKKRGIKGKNLKLVIADDNPAIKSSFDYLQPSVQLQNCICLQNEGCFEKDAL